MTIKQNLLALHNKHRSNHGRRTLALNSVLNAGAQKLSDQMARGQWSHDDFGDDHLRPNGTSFNRWWDNTYKGTFAYNASWAAENLGWDWQTTTDVFGPMGSHGGTGNRWTTSTAHHYYLSHNSFRKVGFGVSRDSRGRFYWVAHFTT
jgi:uncharacterized protein YkwD